MTSPRTLQAILIALLAALLMPALGGAAVPAGRTISNIAQLEWWQGAQRGSRESNRVDITVTPGPAAELEIYRPSEGIVSPDVLGASCTSGQSAPQARVSSSISSLSITPTQNVVAGAPVVLALDRPSANLDPSVIETFTALLQSSTGDREQLTFTETAANSGRFIAIIATVTVPPAPISTDCRLSVEPNEALQVELSDGDNGSPFAHGSVDILVDPFGIAFDSNSGAPIAGVRITLIDASTGLPAQVFGDDGHSVFPSTIVTGQSVTDGGGTVYAFPPGDYRFPLVRAGNYRLRVEPPSPYIAPSSASPQELANLRRPDGEPFAIIDGSFGGMIPLLGPAPVRVDIPLDHPRTPLLLTKSASRSDAEAGDLIQYRLKIRNPDANAPSGPVTVTDRIPEQMRLRGGTVRLSGAKAPDPSVGADRVPTFVLPSIAAGSETELTYILEVRPGARAGDALNRAQAEGNRNNRSNVADALVRIRRQSISDRMTVIGRVFDGGCDANPKDVGGIAGVRIMLEDGSYAVTDRDGNYHFEGVKSGTHVVQLDDLTLPADRALVDCSRNVRSGGRAFSRFVEGHGGSLKRVDFHAVSAQPRAGAAPQRAKRADPPSDATAAGSERDWLAGQEPDIAWLFPAVDHNPRAPVVRIAIKHAPGQIVRLLANGRPVDPIAFDGTRKNAAGTVAVSLWRGIPLEGHKTLLAAEIRNSSGAVVETLSRTVTSSSVVVHAELIRDKSVLVADGVTRPVLALRMTDRDGRPVHHGAAGDFEIPAPYYPAVEADAQQARQLAGLERARPHWRIEGDEGVAFVELEPTTASGTVSMRFAFRDGDQVREQRLEAWLDPGDRSWTIVGLAEGTVGFNRLDKHMESLGEAGDKVDVDGRLALYAKGRIQGRWLLTLAYDSDKKESESQFGGVIDPNSYYTIYADRSERRYDAASVRRLYLKLERPQFFALFGDYDTGIDEPELARYVRSMNGLKAEYRSERVSATAFASDVPTRHRRDEIQGNGLTGPYLLGSRSVLANSERIAIEVRDRLRSERIVESRLLTRHIDYDINYVAGTLRFREPILSRTSSLDPQFVIADYEVDGIAERKLNAGARLAWRSKDKKLQVAATAIHNDDGDASTNLGGLDVRFRPSASTEVRAEVAVTGRNSGNGEATPGDGSALAWQVEAEHHTSMVDLLAYARQRESGFGVGQTNASEDGTRKLGIDGKLRLNESLSFTGSAWIDDYLESRARRLAARGFLEYRRRHLSGRAGIILADDRLADGTSANSTLLQLGATKRLFSNRLELDAQTEFAIGGKDESVDFPARHRLSARYAVTRDVALIGSYEIANGSEADARTARLGFDLAPWAGARIALAGNLQDIAEYGPRSFASYGLSQSLTVSEHWTVDVTLDGNKTIGGIDPALVLNPAHPVASGGYVGNGSTLTEDFTAVTAGATYREHRWSMTGRAEFRDGKIEDRHGATLAALRQIGEGRALGGAFSWFTANADGGASSRVVNAQLSWAHRPQASAWSFLNKLELREDKVEDAIAGVPGPLGAPFTLSGNARSLRVTNALSINYSPAGGRDSFLGLSEISLFWGTRFVADRFGPDDVKGWSNILGADARFDLGDWIEFGGAGTVRYGIGGDSAAFSGGPSIGMKPFDNGWITLGWNVVGYHDRDFEDDRYTRSGPYATIRMKFDQLSIAELGLRP